MTALSEAEALRKYRKFLNKLGKTGNIARSASLSGVSRQSIHKLRTRLPGFGKAVHTALGRYHAQSKIVSRRGNGR